jgi:hypothetical protein
MHGRRQREKHPPESHPPGSRARRSRPGALCGLRLARTRLARAGLAPAGLARAGLGAVAVGIGLGVLAGCGTPAPSTPLAGQTCGTTRTGVNVPVIIEIGKGQVTCGTALQVENSYATLIRNGDVRGNGGGAPVKVSGWTCQGFPTPEVLKTGQTSACHNRGAEVLAVLPPPSARPAGPTTS